eukprot:848028_1
MTSFILYVAYIIYAASATKPSTNPLRDSTTHKGVQTCAYSHSGVWPHGCHYGKEATPSIDDSIRDIIETLTQNDTGKDTDFEPFVCTAGLPAFVVRRFPEYNAQFPSKYDLADITDIHCILALIAVVIATQSLNYTAKAIATKTSTVYIFCALIRPTLSLTLTYSTLPRPCFSMATGYNA